MRSSKVTKLAGMLSAWWLSVAVAWAGSLSGTVVDYAGKGVARAQVLLQSQTGGERQTVRTDQAGEFSLAEVAPGEYLLRVEGGGFQIEEQQLEMGEGDRSVEVRLEPIETRGEITVTALIPGLAGEQRHEGADLVESGVADVAGYFREVAGLSAVRRGTVNMEPSVRGLQEEQLAVFVDGTRTYAAGPARMDSDLSHVGPRSVRGLRIVKGPYALTWGAGTLSAVEVETAAPEFSAGGWRWQGLVGGSYTDNNEATEGAVALSGASERMRFAFDLGRRTGEDYEDGDGNLVPADYQSTEARWRLGFAFSDRLTLDYSGGYQEQFDLDYPGRLLDASYFYTRSHALDLLWGGTGNSALERVEGKLYLNDKAHRMNNDEKPTARPMAGRIPPFGLRVDLPTESDTSGGRLRFQGRVGELGWIAGSDFVRREQQAERFVFRRDNDRLLFADRVWPEAEIEDLGIYGQLTGGGDGYSLGVALRFDSVDATAGQLSDFYLANTVGDPDQSESHWSAAVSSTFEVSDHWNLNAGLGRTMRTATVLERYSDRFPSTKFQLSAEFMGNPLLDPETSSELDLGAQARWGDLRLSIDGFYRLIDDYITVVPDPDLPRRLPLSPPVVYRYVNGSEATYYGGEIDLDHRLHPRFSWRTSVAWVRAQDEELDEPVLGITPLVARLGLRWVALPNLLTLDLDVESVDDQDRVAVSRFERPTPGYTVVDLAARYRPSDTWSLTAAVENLTDRQYSDHLNAPNPFTGQRIAETGRSLRVGFEVEF